MVLAGTERDLTKGLKIHLGIKILEDNVTHYSLLLAHIYREVFLTSYRHSTIILLRSNRIYIGKNVTRSKLNRIKPVQTSIIRCHLTKSVNRFGS